MGKLHPSSTMYHHHTIMHNRNTTTHNCSIIMFNHSIISHSITRYLSTTHHIEIEVDIEAKEEAKNQ